MGPGKWRRSSPVGVIMQRKAFKRQKYTKTTDLHWHPRRGDEGKRGPRIKGIRNGALPMGEKIQNIRAAQGSVLEGGA